MELRWLEDFIALAETRHFSRAAELQNVTQPTFSRRIKLLEEEMGATLVNRQTLPLSLTPAGEEFLALCHDVSQRIAEGQRRLARLAEQQGDRLSLVAPQSLLVHFLPEWLAQWPSPPPITPDLRATGWLIDDYFRALARETCDLVLCYWPQAPGDLALDSDGCDACRLGHERLLPVSLPDADGQPRFRLEAGTRIPLIGYHPRGLFAAALRGHLARLGVAPDFSVLNESIQSSNVRELVALGYGLGWLPERSVRPALDAGQLVPAGDSRWQLTLDIRLFRRQASRHPAMEAFWQSLTPAVSSARAPTRAIP